MARLPQPGSDEGRWGEILNDYLTQAHTGLGTLKRGVVGSEELADSSVTLQKLAPAVRTDLSAKYLKPSTGIPESDLSDAVQMKLNPSATIADGSVTTAKLANGAVTEVKLAPAVVTKLNQTPTVADGSVTEVKLAPAVVTKLNQAPTLADGSVTTTKVADAAVTETKLAAAVVTKLNQTAPVTSVAGKTGVVALVKGDVGLASVDNTSDAAKPISTATQTALNAKYTKPGTGIPESDLSDAVRDKLSASGAAVTVAALPAGSTITVAKASGVWPARPTDRADIVVQWKGPDPSPAIINSGTAGMLNNVDIRFVTP